MGTVTGKYLSLLLPVSREALEASVSPFHAVEIRCTKAGCAAAQALNHQRFLSADAPLLPLPQCEHPAACQCSYRHHDDRRHGPRRSEEAGLPPRERKTCQERRCDGDRRQAGEVTETPDDPLADTYYDYIAGK